jgi:hypothetical protein
MPKISEGVVALGALIIFTAWFLIGLPWLIYPSERIVYRDNTHPAPHASEGQPSGTAQSPFFVQVIPSPKSAEERTEEAEDRIEKKKADAALVRWTLGLFVATIGLILATGVLGYFAYRQSRDMKASIDAAKDSADSTRKQVDALITSERPYIFLKITDPGVTVAGNGEMNFVGKKLKYKFVNYGRTPALLDEIKEHFCIVEGITDAPKPIDPMQDRGRLVPIGTASVNDAPHVQPVNLFFNIVDAGAVKMMKPKASEERRICFSGYVRYHDAFGSHYINGFLAIFSAGGGAWVLRGGDEYNYSRTERPEDIPPHPEYAKERPHGDALP